MIRRMAPTWGAVALAVILLGLGLWSQHRDEVRRREVACTLIDANERIIEGLLALPGARRPELEPYARAYRKQLADLEAARGRLAGGGC